MIDQRELEFADELLKLRGSSLQALIKEVVESIPEEPLCISLRGMKFNERTLAAIREDEEHPERMEVYNSVEDWKKAMEVYLNAD
jgi:hypothetical protein